MTLVEIFEVARKHKVMVSIQVDPTEPTMAQVFIGQQFASSLDAERAFSEALAKQEASLDSDLARAEKEVERLKALKVKPA